jgi:Kdo2-lipid IVA lauroyltransferase/acyltransferase
MRRVSKGHYSVRAHVLVEPPYGIDDDIPVVERYARRLESEIRDNPADWLWVHNKWKYPKPAATSGGPARRSASRVARNALEKS